MRDFVKLPALKVNGLTSETHYNKNLLLGDFDKKDLVVEVVGINPYVGKNDNGDGAHLAFQFQTPPTGVQIGGNHYSSPSVPNTNGYPAIFIRKYLVPVAGAAGSGTFLAGLFAAGVPESALWAPKRVTGGTFQYAGGVVGVSAAAKAKTFAVSDVLYLPTVWEVNNGSMPNVNYDPITAAPATGGENDSNQGVLRAYNSDSARNKGRDWWLASAAGYPNSFIGIANGKFYPWDTSESCGVAPVFCVK
jgi:hypothetical protein